MSVDAHPGRAPAEVVAAALTGQTRRPVQPQRFLVTADQSGDQPSARPAGHASGPRIVTVSRAAEQSRHLPVVQTHTEAAPQREQPKREPTPAPDAGNQRRQVVVRNQTEAPASPSAGETHGSPTTKPESPAPPEATGGSGRGKGPGDETAQDGPEEPKAPRFTMTDEQQTVVRDAAKAIGKGDVFDGMRHFKRLRAVGGTTVMALMAETIYPLAIVGGTASAPGEAGMYLTALTAGILAGPLARTHEKHKAQKILGHQQNVSNVVGAPTELMRSRNKVRKGDGHKRMDLRWYGTASHEPSPAELRSHLARVAAVAATADVGQIVLPQDQVEAYLPKRENFGSRKTQTDWMKDEKHRALVDSEHGEDKLVVVNQAELAELIEGIQVPEVAVTLEKIMHVLKRANADHPAHQWFDQMPTDTDKRDEAEKERIRKLIDEKIKDIFQRRIDRPREDWDIVTDGDKYERFAEVALFQGRATLTEAGEHLIKAQNAEAANGKNKNREAGENSHADAVLVGVTELTNTGQLVIKWRNPHAWHQQHTSPLRFNITDMRHIILNADAYPKNQVQQACEQAAWMSLHGINITLPEGYEGQLVSGGSMIKQADTEDISLAGTLQQRTADYEYGGKRWFRRKNRNGINVTASSQWRRAGHSVPIILAAGAAGAIIGLTASHVTTDANIRVDHALMAQARADGYKGENWAFDPKITTAELDHIFSTTYNADPAYRFFAGPIEDVGLKIEDLASTFAINVEQSAGLRYSSTEIRNAQKDIRGTQPKPCDLCDADTGNIDTSTKNAPVWILKEFNGMKATGFWAQTIFNTLYEGMEWQNPYLQPTPEMFKAVNEARELPSENTLDKSKPLVSVQQEVDFGFNISDPNTFQEPFANYPSAFFTMNGEIIMPIPVLTGTHVVAASMSSPEGSATVRVATMPDGTQALVFPGSLDYLNSLGTVRFWIAPGDGQKLKAQLPLQPDGAVEPPGIDALWAKKLGHPLPTDPQERLSAEIAALAKDYYDLDPLDNQKVIFNREKFAEAVLAGGRENCNVAAGLLAISNPQLLDIVTGWLVSNGHYIAGHDAHEVNLGSNGLIDATPSKMTTAEQKKAAAFFGEPVGKPIVNTGESTGSGNSGSNNSNNDNSGGGADQTLSPDGHGGFQTTQEKANEELLQGLEFLGAIAIGAVAFKNRKRIIRVTNKAGAWSATRSLEHTSDYDLRWAHDDMNFALYAQRNERRPGEMRDSAINRDTYVPEALPTREQLFDFFAQYSHPELAHGYLRLIRQRRGEITDPSIVAGLNRARGIIKALYREETRKIASRKEWQAGFDAYVQGRMKVIAAQETPDEIVIVQRPASRRIREVKEVAKANEVVVVEKAVEPVPDPAEV